MPETTTEKLHDIAHRLLERASRDVDPSMKPGHSMYGQEAAAWRALDQELELRGGDREVWRVASLLARHYLHIVHGGYIGYETRTTARQLLQEAAELAKRCGRFDVHELPAHLQ
ncbi:MAG TPA: hypothetical protein VG479_08330 [Gaiellaceae bacterium]|jgi:hypothetical protein|nr:hypothetical protein [Gaiellaceae bacterium]